MHLLLISENLFFNEIECKGITSFMEFMKCVISDSVGINERLHCYIAKKLQFGIGLTLFLIIKTDLVFLIQECYEIHG